MYIVGAGNMLKEFSFSGGSSISSASGEIPQNPEPVTVLPGSYLTACTWSKNKMRLIRVYYQDTKGHVQEVSWDGTSWKKGSSPEI